MNERLLDICIKAGINTWPFNEVGFISLDESELVKFAELILIEVTDILSTYRGKVVFTDGAEYNYEHPIIAIRKHFGVEL